MKVRRLLLFSLTMLVGCGEGQILEEGLTEGEQLAVEDEQVDGEDLAEGEEIGSIEGGLRSCVTAGTQLSTVAAINFRSAPYIRAPKLGVLPRNAKVTVLGSCPQPGYYSYFNVRYEGTTGWAAGRYLTAAPQGPTSPSPITPEPEPTLPPVTPPPGPEQVGKLQVPYISQYRPDGADSSYINGSANCGPTSMAMIGRYYGFGAGMTDAQLVTLLARADGKPTGATNAEGIKVMAATLGKPVGHQLGPDLDFLDRSLAAGKPVAARGIFTSVRHYIVVTGKNADGNYTVNDPASSSRKTVTPGQLSTFIRNHPEGAFFSIG